MAVDLKWNDNVESAQWVEPVKGQPLTFQSVGQGSAATTLIPLHRVYGERYGVYWKVNKSGPRMG
jgi:hypothetical protein